MAKLRSFALCSLLALTGCTKIPEGRSAVDSVSVMGARAIDPAAIEDAIGTAPSPKFLGLFRGVAYDYEVYDPFALQRDLARIERLYHARGYYDAHARAGRVLATSDRHVRIEILVEEGRPVLNHEVRVVGLDGVPTDIAETADKIARRRMRIGRPFDEDKLSQAEKDVRRTLTDRGYAFAKVKSDGFVDVVRHEATVVLTVTAGPTATFGKVTITGRGDLPEEPLLRAIDIEEGAPYSTAAIDDATQALLDLGVMSSVEITPDLTESPSASSRAVPINVKVEPTKLRRLRLGGGIEFDQIKTDVHLVFGWEDHNFLGSLRDFSVDFKPGLVLYPTRINQIALPERLLPEERLRLQLRQPGFLESRTSGFVRPELNTFPLLVKTDPAASDPVVGYIEFKGGVGLDRAIKKLFGSIAYNAQVEDPFVYKGDLDPALRTLVISYPELITQLDLRDNRIHPRGGIYLANDLQVAGGPFLGDATDLKVQPEVRTYLPISRRVTFATRATVGFLFPSNYGDVVRHELADPLTDANRAARVRDIETVFFRGFFSGGASSNRGFPIRGIAPRGVVPFLNPQTATQQVALSCDPSPANNFSPDPTLCSIPVGGFTLWELSNEVRVDVAGPFSVATFCDMGDVSATPGPAGIRLDHLHLSCGLGARYDTPVGPIRLDVGYRVQPLQVLGFVNEVAAAKADPSEGVQPRILGQPVAVAIGIGEAF